MIFTYHTGRFVAATCRGDVSQRFVASCVSALKAQPRKGCCAKAFCDEGLNGGGSTCWLRVKISLLCRLSVKIFDLCRLSAGKSQLIFLSLVGNFFLVLSVVSNIFSPFVVSRLTPFTPFVIRFQNNTFRFKISKLFCKISI